jgi:excisionase family DNA binding protein
MKDLPKDELEKLIRQNWSTKGIAQYYRISARTVTRMVKAFGLKGLRPRGRKPRIRRRQHLPFSNR